MKHELRPGKLTRVDVENQGSIVLTLKARRGDLHEMPVAKVFQQYTGFTAVFR
jgi:hypothetical protein